MPSSTGSIFTPCCCSCLSHRADRVAVCKSTESTLPPSCSPLAVHPSLPRPTCRYFGLKGVSKVAVASGSAWLLPFCFRRGRTYGHFVGRFVHVHGYPQCNRSSKGSRSSYSGSMAIVASNLTRDDTPISHKTIIPELLHGIYRRSIHTSTRFPSILPTDSSGPAGQWVLISGAARAHAAQRGFKDPRFQKGKRPGALPKHHRFGEKAKKDIQRCMPNMGRNEPPRISDPVVSFLWARRRHRHRSYWCWCKCAHAGSILFPCASLSFPRD